MFFMAPTQDIDKELEKVGNYLAKRVNKVLEKYDLNSNVRTSKAFKKEDFIVDLTKELGNADDCIKSLKIESAADKEKVKQQFAKLTPEITKLADEAEHFHKKGKTELPRWRKALNAFGTALATVASAVLTVAVFAASAMFASEAWGAITSTSSSRNPVAAVGKFFLMRNMADSAGAIAGASASMTTELGANTISQVKSIDTSKWHKHVTTAFCDSVLKKDGIELTQAQQPSGPSAAPNKANRNQGVQK